MKEITDNMETEQILGIEGKTFGFWKDWDKMSTANKVAKIKEKYKDILVDDTHILNFLTPKTTQRDMERTGIQQLEFLHNK